MRKRREITKEMRKALLNSGAPRAVVEGDGMRDPDRPLRSLPMQDIPVDPATRIRMERFGSVGIRALRLGQCKVLLSRDGPDRIWHLSISHKSRLPTWHELIEARYRLVPDEAEMAILLPSRAEYVNLHPNCLHLYQVDRPAEASAGEGGQT